MSFAEIAAFTLHDVKNNLAECAGLAEQKGDIASRNRLLKAADDLSRLLIYYRCENDLLQPQIDAHAPSDLLHELAANLAFAMPAHLKLELDLSRAPTLGFYDPHLLRMLLAHAAHNAQRFAHGLIRLSASETEHDLEFCVADDGAGYPDEICTNETSLGVVSRNGTGLGLHLARHIAALHQNAGRSGCVRLYNQNGAVFVLALPR